MRASVRSSVHASWGKIVEVVMSEGDTADQHRDDAAHVQQFSYYVA